jgi:hypothetical protein
MANWSGAGTGALSGAATGAAFGPWGAGVGGVLGGILGLLSGDDDELSKIDAGTPEQQALHNRILAQAMGMDQPGGGYQNAQNYYNRFLGGNQQEAYNQFASPYLQQFNEQILPQIAERFAGAGALSSSGFGQSLGGAAAGLQAKLAQLFSDLQGQAASSLTNQYNQLSQAGLNYQPFAYNKKEGSAGFGNTFLTGLTGEVGKATGNALGQKISDLFKPKAAAGGIT